MADENVKTAHRRQSDTEPDQPMVKSTDKIT
ncbi:MAG: hypothetical protein ACI9J4_001187 [Paraglaciecola sp.]|jgi:hypothetical protein